MRKIISLTLATAMVASMGVSAFAADPVKDTAVELSVSEDATYAKVTVNGQTFEGTGKNANEVALSLGEAISDQVSCDVLVYLKSDVAAEMYVLDGTETKVVLRSKDDEILTVENPTGVTVAEVAGEVEIPVNEIADIRGWQSNWRKIIDETPLAESGDWNANDGIKPGKKLYFRVKDPFSDLDIFKFDVSKGENAKQIKKVSVVEKRFGSGLVTTDGAGGENYVPGTSGRNTFVQVELADNMNDTEYKVSFDMKVKVDKAGYGLTKGTSSDKFEEIAPTWMFNSTTSNNDDIEYMAGTGGIMVKPVKNEENTVLWTDENRDLAQLTFTADSDVAKYFPKLSTKWPNATYAQLFDDQDAFVFDFVGNPAISSTSRAVLELYCPFLDDDDEYTIDPESVVIYQVADDATLAASTEVELAKAILDGRLIDVTDKFTAGENEDGDFVYTTKTRTLGTYIIAEKAPSEEAFDEAEGEANDEKPADETGKTNPGTGR